ncbi:hypothetical protein ACFLTH_14280, partial [Bacteroidota bacterium]
LILTVEKIPETKLEFNDIKEELKVNIANGKKQELFAMYVKELISSAEIINCLETPEEEVCGGDLIIKELMGVAELDFVTKAPDGKEVEEITQKEIHKALRGKIAAEQAKMESNSSPKTTARPVERKTETRPAPSNSRDREEKPAPASYSKTNIVMVFSC